MCSWSNCFVHCETPAAKWTVVLPGSEGTEHQFSSSTNTSGHTEEKCILLLFAEAHLQISTWKTPRCRLLCSLAQKEQSISLAAGQTLHARQKEKCKLLLFAEAYLQISTCHILKCQWSWPDPPRCKIWTQFSSTGKKVQVLIAVQIGLKQRKQNWTYTCEGMYEHTLVRECNTSGCLTFFHYHWAPIFHMVLPHIKI